jgi:hypothetical protein
MCHALPDCSVDWTGIQPDNAISLMISLIREENIRQGRNEQNCDWYSNEEDSAVLYMHVKVRVVMDFINSIGILKFLGLLSLARF